MSRQNGFRAALINGDVDLLARMWGAWFPGKHAPADRREAEVQLHAARTAADSVPLNLRAYSHHWLKERALPSLLPAEMEPKAERYRPKVVSAVGFAWDSNSALLKPAKARVMAAVENKIEELAADGMLENDPELVRREMMFAKNRELHSLFGPQARSA